MASLYAGLIRGGVIAATLFPLSAATQAAPLSYTTSIQANSPYAYYRLGEISGTAATDSSSNGRNGTYMNTPTLGLAGASGDTAAGFSGTSPYSYLSLTNMNSFGPSLKNFSMELILKSTSTGAKALFGEINSGNNTSIQLISNFNGTAATAGVSYVALRADGGHTLLATFNSVELNSGNFTQLAMTFSFATGLKVYINGAEVALSSQSSTLTGTENFSAFEYPAAVMATNQRGTVGTGTAGTLDEAAFFNSVLSGSDVLGYYQALTAVPEPASLGLLALGFVAVLKKRK